MRAESGEDTWDVVLRPRTTPRYAAVAAALTVLVGIAIALTLRNKSTGPTLRVADQFAMAALAVIMAGAVLLLTRPRLKVGPSGLAVRNVLGYRVIPWDEVVDFSFPEGRRWARVDLAHNEYFPVLAIQSNDRDRAVAAMDTVRELMGSYRRPGDRAG